MQKMVLCTILATFAMTGCHSTSTLRTPNGVAVDELPSREFRFSYDVTIPTPPSGSGHLDVWVPLPLSDPGVQEVRDLKINAPYGHSVHTEPVFGNRMIHFRVDNPSSPTFCSWSAHITRREDHGQGGRSSSPRYLAPNNRIPLDGTARELALQLGSGDRSQPLHVRTRRIYDDVLEEMEYNKSVPGYGHGDFERSVTICKGNCTDFHSRFIGVARASRIPVRFSMGIPLKPTPRGRYNSYHCWAHYHDGDHWHPVDISEADKIVSTDPARADWLFRHVDMHRVSLSFGRDIRLSPPQAGPPLNYFVFPHAEVDGEQFKLDKTMWSFEWTDI